MTDKREDLEQQIAATSAEYRQARRPLVPADIQALLPRGTAFIDILEYAHHAPNQARGGVLESEAHYLAFVVLPGDTTKLVRLGSVASAKSAIRAFRRFETATRNEVAQQLRNQLWLPLEKHLGGIHTVILSPDTALGTLSFASLPGEADGTYLIEKYKFVTVPVARMLPSRSSKSPSRPPAEMGLLVLGDVDYDANPLTAKAEPKADSHPAGTRRSAPRGESAQWKSLPGFLQELAIVRDQFESGLGGGVTTLQKDEATEAEFIAQASKHRVLHLITHGFFADPEFESLRAPTDDDQGQAGPSMRTSLARNMTINQYLPGMLSGIALAGANNPPPADDPKADGVLTASEIETLDLGGVDLVVLSACETGLGKTAGGEGLTGLQRAFHMAGARSCIATLWEVDDRATQELIRRFYENLWGRKMSRIDALREAQIWMLRHPRELEAMGVKGAASRGKPRKTPEPVTTEVRDRIERTDPYFWAAFQLSGDWR